MKRKRYGGFIAGVGLLLTGAMTGIARGESFRIGDYELWLSAAQRQDRVVLDGRISGGEECRRLELVAHLENSRGDGMLVKTVIHDAGGFGSRLIEGAAPCRHPRHPWTVYRVELRCRPR